MDKITIKTVEKHAIAYKETHKNYARIHSKAVGAIRDLIVAARGDPQDGPWSHYNPTSGGETSTRGLPWFDRVSDNKSLG